ncbi:hypothetical protein C8P66_11315 [Humitalea rosea]|uniref:DNA gyrase inhibitor YacG n=1 Tax=Humitalea rosea TaxID=990373 RepID=A0A2W7IEF7_9PROT|nr:DNA gyrase inhibitor YacG [Humitalea rosea]PZW44849.1 hypothetical protein C8P66_11315 [Humitalea rosea]
MPEAAKKPSPKPSPKPGPKPCPKPCPICRRPMVEAFRPFCSDRCRQVDLGRWLTEAYVVPGPAVEEPEPE